MENCILALENIIKNCLEECEGACLFYSPDYICKCKNAELLGWLKELQALKDKQEQGLLISVPCKVGDKVWVIDDNFECAEFRQKKKIYEAEWVRVTLVQNKADGSFDLRGEVKYQVHDCFYNDGRTMLHGMYVGQESTKVGERVFLTRSEAEEALAKMEVSDER